MIINDNILSVFEKRKRNKQINIPNTRDTIINIFLKLSIRSTKLDKMFDSV